MLRHRYSHRVFVEHGIDDSLYISEVRERGGGGGGGGGGERKGNGKGGKESKQICTYIIIKGHLESQLPLPEGALPKAIRIPNSTSIRGH